MSGDRPLLLPPIGIKDVIRLAERILEIKTAQLEGTATEDMISEMHLIGDLFARMRTYMRGELSLDAAKGAQS